MGNGPGGRGLIEDGKKNVKIGQGREEKKINMTRTDRRKRGQNSSEKGERGVELPDRFHRKKFRVIA